MNPPAVIAARSIAGVGDGPRLVVIAGVHGDEYEPMEAVRRLAATLVATPFRGSVTLVPVANPTAFAAATRCGADGLDMARSFPGDTRGSPTQQAAHAVTSLIRAADFLIDLHTGGRVMRILPMAGYTLHPDPAILDMQRRMARAFGLPLIWGTTHTLEGRSLSAARDLRVPAIYAEHGGGGGYDPSVVHDYVSGCLGVMREVGMVANHDAAAVRAAAPAGGATTVEDPRQGSGHLQASHPSPADGFFLPVVRLGETVRTGDLVGTVGDPLGDDVREIRAEATGLVLVLRAEPRVRAGDALVVILDRPGKRASGAAAQGAA